MLGIKNGRLVNDNHLYIGGNNEKTLTNYRRRVGIGFAVPTFAQETNKPDPQLRERLIALIKNYDEVFNKNDAPALAVFFTEDAVFVTETGPIYGREAIVKHFADLFQKVHFSDHLGKPDECSPHIIGNEEQLA
jgi:hypothetical protein